MNLGYVVKKPVLRAWFRYGLTLLHFAALHGNREAVAELLDRKADPCRADSQSGFLPLQRAIHHGHWEVRRGRGLFPDFKQNL